MACPVSGLKALSPSPPPYTPRRSRPNAPPALTPLPIGSPVLLLPELGGLLLLPELGGLLRCLTGGSCGQRFSAPLLMPRADDEGTRLDVSVEVPVPEARDGPGRRKGEGGRARDRSRATGSDDGDGDSGAGQPHCLHRDPLREGHGRVTWMGPGDGPRQSTHSAS